MKTTRGKELEELGEVPSVDWLYLKALVLQLPEKYGWLLHNFPPIGSCPNSSPVPQVIPVRIIMLGDAHMETMLRALENDYA